MKSPETESGEVTAETTTPELPPLTNAEITALEHEYSVASPLETNAAVSETTEKPGLLSEIKRLGEYADDPAELGALLLNNIGENYLDPISGESTIKPHDGKNMTAILQDLGQAIGLLKDGGSSESIQRLIDSAWNNISLLPQPFRNPMQNIAIRYYDKAKAESKL